MPKQRTVLTIFVASPDDVAVEREILKDVVRELNLTWSSSLGIQLDLVEWTTHARPGIGLDPQSVINQQLGDDFDIFIGIMWTRFGSPTGRAGSGTEEEFTRALERYRTDPSSIKIMFYFKDEAVPPSSLDLVQYSRVRDFRERLGSEGALYWRFTSEFDSFVRIHLAREIQEWLRASSETGTRPAPTEDAGAARTEYQPLQVVADDDEAGLLDHMEAFAAHFGRLKESQIRLTASLEDLGSRVEERAAEQRRANENQPGDLRLMKGNANRLAQDMLHFVSRTEAELPIFASEMQEGMQSFTMALTLATDFGPRAFGDLGELRSSVQTSADVIATTTAGTVTFRQAIAASPRLTTEYNRAKRRTVEVIDRLIEHLRTGSSLLQEVLRAIDGLAGPAA